MKKPDFFIIGAPKGGTTSLAAWLADHPQVYMSSAKEPHFFNTDEPHHLSRSLSKYESLFEGAGIEHRAVGEASTGYLLSQVAVSNILNYNADALGSQLERLYSQVSRDRICLLLLDDVKKCARVEWEKILAFLNIVDDERVDFPVYNAAKER